MTAMAALVDGMTQSMKTWKVIDLIRKKVVPKTRTLVMFITQANNVTSVHQIITRLENDKGICDIIFEGGGIMRTAKADEKMMNAMTNGANVMLVDYWNSKNTNKMLEICRKHEWEHMIVVIDECEQGYKNGIRSRLAFIGNVEAAHGRSPFVIFVTATVANLSKCIVEIGLVGDMSPTTTQHDGSVIHNIIHNDVVEHYYAVPKKEYIGPSWFVKENPGQWVKLVFTKPEKTENMDKQAFKNACKEARLATIDRCLAELPERNKEFCLIVTSNIKSQHKRQADRVFELGFNVAIELNSENAKNYIVRYKREQEAVGQWVLPFSEVEHLAAGDKLDRYVLDGKTHKTGIQSAFDITIPYMLKACLFMGRGDVVRERVAFGEYVKLCAIQNAVLTLVGARRCKPDDFPITPKVAIVAGNIAGRGNTFQNAAIDLACSAFCFVGTADGGQRGASNAQRFGRACGMLAEIFNDPDRRPVLIATEHIVKQAMANEVALTEKARSLKDGQLVALKSLVSTSDWENAMAKTKDAVAEANLQHGVARGGGEVTCHASAVRHILEYLDAAGGVASLSWKKLRNYHPELSRFLEKQNNNTINRMMHDGLIEATGKKAVWRRVVVKDLEIGQKT